MFQHRPMVPPRLARLLFGAAWRVAAILAGTATATAAAAQQPAAYPASPVRVIVPHPAGGPADMIGRLTAQVLGAALQQSFFVDNRPGGGSLLGAAAVASAAPDGQTLLVNASVHVIYPAIFKDVSFDVLRDFTPVTQLTRVPMVLLVHPDLPVRTTEALLAYARAHPGKLSFASSGNGGAHHLSAELLKQMANIDMVHVPYRGGAPGLNALMGGQVQVMIDSVSSSLPHIQSGRVRALAVTSAQRARALPDVPTLGESGVPGYVLENWYGLWAPKGTPSAIVERLAMAAARGLREPAMAARLEAGGAEIVASSPADFGAFCAAEKRKWADIVARSGAKLD